MRSLALSLVALIGCNGPNETDGVDTDTDAAAACGAPYEPFDPANYENQFLRVDAYQQIVEIRKSEEFEASDFDQIESLYNENDLSAKVQGRGDDHEYASVVAIGEQMHADITAAIAAGKADDNIAAQGQIIDKTLQRFFYLSVYHETMKSQLEPAEANKGWDEGFGYFGIENDGQNPQGIAATLSKRDEEFGLSLVDTAFNGLVDGRCALESGDAEVVVAAIDTVDLAMLRGFSASVVHEMDEYADDTEIKFVEAELYFHIVADHVESLDADAHAAIAAEFDKGADGLDPAVVRAAIVSAYGFSF